MRVAGWFTRAKNTVELLDRDLRQRSRRRHQDDHPVERQQRGLAAHQGGTFVRWEREQGEIRPPGPELIEPRATAVERQPQCDLVAPRVFVKRLGKLDAEEIGAHNAQLGARRSQRENHEARYDGQKAAVSVRHANEGRCRVAGSAGLRFFPRLRFAQHQLVATRRRPG